MALNKWLDVTFVEATVPRNLPKNLPRNLLHLASFYFHLTKAFLFQTAVGKSKLLDKVKVKVFSGSNAPININFPNPKGVEGYDPDIPAKELLKDVPTIARQQAKLLKKELLENSGSFEKPELLEDIGLLRHDEARVEYRFDSEEVF